MLKTICPTCRHNLEAPPKYAGKTWRCPDCRTAYVVPDPSHPPPKLRRWPFPLSILAWVLRGLRRVLLIATA